MQVQPVVPVGPLDGAVKVKGLTYPLAMPLCMSILDGTALMPASFNNASKVTESSG